MGGNVKELNPSDFQKEVLSSDKPVLVDFRAPWCGPCRMLGPVFEQLSGQYANDVKFVKINVDEAQDIAMQYGIQGIPTILVFQGGQMHGEPLVGVRPTEEYQAIIEGLISGESVSGGEDVSDSSVQEITGQAQLDEAVGGDKVYVVDFRASWCGPCRMLGPVLEKIGGEYSDKVAIIKINVEQPENQELAMKFGVSGIPHVVIMKSGKQVDQFVGALPYDAVKEVVEKHI